MPNRTQDPVANFCLKHFHWAAKETFPLLDFTCGTADPLVFLPILGTSMVIGDGILTPCISGHTPPPGVGLLYSELVQGIPPIFPHFVSNILTVHSVMVLVSIKSLPISKVPLDERFRFRQIEPRDYLVFRCIVRHGYNDRIEKPEVFEQQLVEKLKEFIRHEHFILEDAPGIDQVLSGLLRSWENL